MCVLPWENAIVIIIIIIIIIIVIVVIIIWYNAVFLLSWYI